MSDRPDFTVVTPSYNSGDYLPRACASVADQEGVAVEHVVVDGLSTDGTVEWLRANPRVTGVVGKDDGMYDAINRGLARARGRFLGYLNCDEQYLPGALASVKRFFDENPRTDLVFGDIVVVDGAGRFLAFRKGYPARRPYILASHLYVPSCALFFRRRVVDEGQVFDTSFRYIGDHEFVARLLGLGYRIGRVRRYLSAFAITGSNLSRSPRFLEERARVAAARPRWVRALGLPLNVARLAEKALSGAYHQRAPFEYAVYGPDDLSARRTHRVDRVTFRYPGWDAVGAPGGGGTGPPHEGATVSHA